jgi:hypothetical protein
MSLVIQLIGFSCRTGIYADLDRYMMYLRDDRRLAVNISAYGLRARIDHASQVLPL